jgi:hypothetical protein
MSSGDIASLQVFLFFPFPFFLFLSHPLFFPFHSHLVSSVHLLRLSSDYFTLSSYDSFAGSASLHTCYSVVSLCFFLRPTSRVLACLRDKQETRFLYSVFPSISHRRPASRYTHTIPDQYISIFHLLIYPPRSVFLRRPISCTQSLVLHIPAIRE